MEPKIVGASFNKAYQNKVSPIIEGTTGVFVMKVNGIQSKPAETAEALQQRVSSRSTALRNQTGSWFEGLRKQADIKDERSKHF
jgi:peptidyl-prolyl cis-trans isomerase D